ncbi:uncharacterized protein LOC131599940 isoform X2 [Vicia villosa]|uniref:uncharacterized protein LOC131599940 isoform X2 n=1 Tax=Vicia villosa TaxID=3911 RepID=UPI00273A87C1|nr:uncharacterized protein LOC131599940 isoform X2 [Vicia villosa]
MEQLPLNTSEAKPLASPEPLHANEVKPLAASQPLHTTDLDDADENVKQLDECSSLYLLMQELERMPDRDTSFEGML